MNAFTDRRTMLRGALTAGACGHRGDDPGDRRGCDA
jgi:hypothetical protein